MENMAIRLQYFEKSLLTNRVEDLPNWFQLYPTEVCNILAYKILDKFNNGEYPEQPIDGPNIWRVRSSDRVIWIGDERPDIESYDGLLKIFDISECCLLIGDPMDGIADYIGFSGIDNDEDAKLRIKQTRKAMGIVKGMGISREISIEWYLG